MKEDTSQDASSSPGEHRDVKQVKPSVAVASADPLPPSKSMIHPAFHVLVASGVEANANLACLQLLYACEPLRKHFISNAFEVDNVYLVLGELFGLMENSDPKKGPINVTKLHAKLLDSIWPHIRTAPSFLEGLLATANIHLKTDDRQQCPSFLETMLTWKMQCHQACFECGNLKFTEKHDNWMLNLELATFEDNTSLRLYLNQFFGDRILKDFCKKCNAFRECSKWISLQQTGPLLLIYVNRFCKDGQGYMSEHLIQVDQQIELIGGEYQLTGAVLHRELATDARHWTLVRQSDDAWVEVDGHGVQLHANLADAKANLDRYCLLLLYTRLCHDIEHRPQIDVSNNRPQEELSEWRDTLKKQASETTNQQPTATLSPPQRSGYCGLANLGLSCYANSCLQMLFTLPVFRQYILAHPYEGQFHKSLSELFAAMEYESTRFEIIGLTNASLRPEEFMAEFRAAKEDFRAFQMADAQEFLTILLELVHQEVNSAKKSKSPEVVPKSADEAWQFHLAHIDNSFWSSQLMGQIESTLCCRTCTHKSLSWSSFWQLQLPLGANQSEVTAITLTDCIKEFLTEETLNEDSRPFCDKCATRQPATKRATICRAPKYLLVHLTRFAADRTKNARSVAIDERIELSSRNFILVGAVLHWGTEDYGHYIALHRQEDGQWIQLDDETVKQINESNAIDLLRAHAYLCVYQAVD